MLWHMVQIELEGIPLHAWGGTTAQNLLRPYCLVESIDPHMAARHDLAVFRLTARTTRPELIPDTRILAVPEPAHDETQFHPVRNTLKYVVKIRVRRLLVRMQPDSPPASPPPTPPTSDSSRTDDESPPRSPKRRRDTHGRSRRPRRETRVETPPPPAADSAVGDPAAKATGELQPVARNGADDHTAAGPTEQWATALAVNAVPTATNVGTAPITTGLPSTLHKDDGAKTQGERAWEDSAEALWLQFEQLINIEVEREPNSADPMELEVEAHRAGPGENEKEGPQGPVEATPQFWAGSADQGQWPISADTGPEVATARQLDMQPMLTHTETEEAPAIVPQPATQHERAGQITPQDFHAMISTPTPEQHPGNTGGGDETTGATTTAVHRPSQESPHRERWRAKALGTEGTDGADEKTWHPWRTAAANAGGPRSICQPLRTPVVPMSCSSDCSALRLDASRGNTAGHGGRMSVGAKSKALCTGLSPQQHGYIQCAYLEHTRAQQKVTP